MAEKSIKEEVKSNDIMFASKFYPVKDLPNKEEFKPVERSAEIPAVTNNLTFDVYFEILKTKNSKIRDHHKNAMRIYCEKIGKLTTTEIEFDKMLENY